MLYENGCQIKIFFPECFFNIKKYIFFLIVPHNFSICMPLRINVYAKDLILLEDTMPQKKDFYSILEKISFKHYNLLKHFIKVLKGY